MPKQKVPDIDFTYFVLSEIKDLFDEGKIFINKSYQRGDIWKHTQKLELIKSIENRYSIGVLVLFKNDDGNFEILDGQQRLITINQYLNGELDLRNTEIIEYIELEKRDKTLIDAYCVYYLRLKSHDPDTKEEDIVQIFLRLQEGTPLNKAEKISAHRGAFKDTFLKARETHSFFSFLGKEKRFRFRQLAAEMLLIELESDFDNLVFPGLDLDSLIAALRKYERRISKKRVRLFTGNLDFLTNSLNLILTAFTPREAISFYMLVSYLRKKKADNVNLNNELNEFASEFLKNINSFSMYDEAPPKGMSKKLFVDYRTFKYESKILTTPESLKKRFNIMLKEFKRMKPFIKKDKKRLFDVEQKRKLFFRQDGLCIHCHKPLNFHVSSAHHGIAHSRGGSTKKIDKAKLMHERCHQRLEAKLAKKKRKRHS